MGPMNLLVSDALFDPSFSLFPALDNFRDGLDYSDIELLALGRRWGPSVTRRSKNESWRRCGRASLMRAYTR